MRPLRPGLATARDTMGPNLEATGTPILAHYKKHFWVVKAFESLETKLQMVAGLESSSES